MITEILHTTLTARMAERIGDQLHAFPGMDPVSRADRGPGCGVTLSEFKREVSCGLYSISRFS
jgi:hypothetical protein